MTAHVHGVDMPIPRQLGHNLIPTAGVKPCGMYQQNLLPAGLTPFKYTQIDIGKTNQLFFRRHGHRLHLCLTLFCRACWRALY